MRAKSTFSLASLGKDSATIEAKLSTFDPGLRGKK